jgi:hypothetical protein
VYRHLNACSPLPARIFLAFKSWNCILPQKQIYFLLYIA